MVSSSNMAMDRGIGRASASYSANYSQPSYAIPHVTNFSAPHATRDIHNSAMDLHNGYSRMSGNSVEARVHSSSTVAYGNDDWKKQLLENFYEFQDLHRKLIERPHDPATIQAYEAYKKRIAEHQSYETRVSPSQLQSFSNTSLPKETPSVGGQAYPSWAEAEEKYLARTNNVKPKPIEKNVDNIITFDDLSNEQRQAYEVLRKKRREESEARRK
jgi:hypothetical protein